ncbi:MAG: tRNA-dihydrouridine synthase, partial [Pseudomonadota bacterium]
SVSIPVFANGDIDSVEKSLEVLRLSNADGLMIGRAAQGRPWIFQELAFGLGKTSAKPQLEKNFLRDMMLGHLNELHRFYGEQTGVRVARKHLTWYSGYLANAEEFRYRVVRVDSASEQLQMTRQYFDRPDGGVCLAA